MNWRLDGIADGWCWFRQGLGPEDIFKTSAFEIVKHRESLVRLSGFQKGYATGFSYVVFEVVEMQQVALIVAATKYNMSACRIVTKGT